MLHLLKRLSLILTVGFILILHTPVLAGMPGEAAPELRIKEWVQGGPFTLQGGAGRSIYVIEFWQTDCPHCLESLPYLSILQEKHKKDGVVFLGITNEDAATVSAFLKGNQDAEYALAIDDDDKTYDRYMGLFDVSGVPHAFIVGRKGRVLWQGHPMDNLDVVLGQIVAGHYDLGEAQNAARAGKLLAAYAYLAVETEEHDLVRQTGERVYAYGRNDPRLLTKLVRFILNNPKIKSPDLELAVKAAKRACALTGDSDPETLDLYATLLQHMGADEEAQAVWTKAKQGRRKGAERREGSPHMQDK